MDHSIESGSPSRHIIRFTFAATFLIAISSVGYGQGPLAPATKLNDKGPLSTNSDSGSMQQPPGQVNQLTRDEAVRLALVQASAFQTARYVELIAAEDVRQARAAFLPRITIPATFIYNSPTPGPVPPGTPSAERFSFIAANAVAEYNAVAGAVGEIDIAGRLRATLKRGVALLEAARAGTEIARRALIEAVDESYFGYALSTAKRRSSELSLTAAEEFAHITVLMFNAGEVAQVDVTRARLQVASRRDELEQARASESVAAGGLRVLVGYDFTRPIDLVDLTSTPPDAAEIDRFLESAIQRRPELIQFDAQRRAADEERKAARAERLPQLFYSITGGFDSDSLRGEPLFNHTGVLATMGVTIPIFDWGASRSREQQ